MTSRSQVIGLSVLSLSLTAIQTRPAPAVQVGYCVGLPGLESAKAAGFDYVELGASAIAALSDADFELAVEHVRQVGLPTPNANLFLPGTIRLTGPQPTDPAEQMAYVKKTFDRLARLGVKVVCFGSGGSRRVPAGFSKEEAFKQLVDFGRRIAPEARAKGMTVVIEPLRRQESNIINSAGEGLQLVKAVDDPNFELLIDFYHLASEKEDPKVIFEAKDHLRHLHMANPHGRVFPLKWDEYDYAPFFANLRQIGYAGRISVEASSNDFANEAPQTVALLRRAFGQGLPRPGSHDRLPRPFASPAPQELFWGH